MKIIKNDEAVSPVIGTILMVAITVILAAVITAFVFGMVGTTTTTKTVGMTVSTDSNGYVVVTIQGGADLPSLTNISYSNNSGGNYYTFVKRSDSQPLVYPLNVGETINSSGKITHGTRVIIKGTFSDGSDQILYDRTL
jgi:flagellin-like protein